MDTMPQRYAALAEALCGPVRLLTAGLLFRPVAAAWPGQDEAADGGGNNDRLKVLTPADLARLIREVREQTGGAVREMRDTLEMLKDAEIEDVEDLVEELTAPALELVERSRSIWSARFAGQAEKSRSLAATLAEAPVAALIDWSQGLVHCLLNPWEACDNPESPEISFDLEVDDGPILQALREWTESQEWFPGGLSEENG